MYDAAFIGFARNAYLPRASDWPHPYASPARADLQSYPPAMVVSGGADPLLDDNRAFVEKLRAAGTEVTWFERSGMPHGYYFFPGLMPEGDEALWDAAAREASEEAGVDGAVARSEIGCYYYAKLQPSGAEKRCEVHVFPMEIDQVKDRWPERKQRKRRWFSPLEAARSVREQDLADLIARFSANPRQSAA